MEKRLKIVKAVCFGLGVMIGLSVTMFVFARTDALSGAIGGMCGAMLGMALFAGYLKLSN